MQTSLDNLSTDKNPQSHLDLQEIAVVCAADDRYAMPLAVTVKSAIENLDQNFKIVLFIIDGGIERRNQQKILQTLASARCEVNFISKPDTYISGLEDAYKYTVTEGKAKNYISIAQYYRLFIAELLPENINKAIYLDCDLVVCGDLSQLWQADLGDNFILAAQDTWVHSVSAPNGLLVYQQLGISPDAPYFNSGVLSLDLAKWRAEKVYAQAIAYLNRYKEDIIYGDQDILNAMFFGKWGKLDPRWNVTARVYEYSSYQDSPYSEDVYHNLVNTEPYIIHFVSGEKPWNTADVPFKERFFHYLDLTAWSGWRFTIWKKLRLRLAYKVGKAIALIRIKIDN